MFNNRGNDAEEDRHRQDRKQREHRRDYLDPIKQYVRMHGWVPAAKERHRKITDSGKTHLTYFTLCAGNAIDVLLFNDQDLIFYDKREFPDVVFCERSTDVYEEIGRKLGRTFGYRASFEDLILKRETEDSIDFYLKLPFDIYNLDFSGFCFPRKEPPFSSTLKSIVILIEELEKLENPQGFDMFFTFRAQRSEENEDAIRDLRNNMRDNRNNFPRFNELITQRYGNNLEGLQRGYHELLLISLPKYLGRIGNELGFKVSITHRYCYPRPNLINPQYHIISFGLCFDWIRRNTEVRRGVRQPVPRHEITTEAYREMMMQLVSDDIPNVASTRFSHENYANQVQQFLQTGEDE